jgi:O-antigen/teichoic acid export membrane protein
LILGTQLDILILNRYVSKDHLADYALANKLYSIFLIISTTLFNTLLQHVSSLKNVNDQLLFAKRLSKLVFFPVIILYAVFVFIPMDGVSTFLNLQKYESSFSLVKILVIPFFVSIITSSYVAFYFVRDKMESVFKINTFILCLSVPLKIYLSLTFFSLGMTVASAISASLLPLIVSIIVNFKKQNV